MLALSGLLFSLLAQVDHNYNPNDRVLIVNETIIKNQVPSSVLKALNTEFDKTNQLTWSKFPLALQEYDWVYNVGSSNLNLNRFKETLKTRECGDLWAVYAPNGNLIATREVSKNTAFPQAIQTKLANSQYKDWTVVGDREILRYYCDNVKLT